MPDDTTPHGGEAFHELPERARIPQPEPDHETGSPPHEHDPRATEPHAGDLTGRPALPEHPAPAPADPAPDPAQAGGLSARDAEDGKSSATQQPA